jgi:DNA invertase Pin-like site-specific DNA recombinase
MMANVLATFAQFERRLIGQRTREALAIKQAQGVRLGRPRTMPNDVVARIVAERSAGRTLAAIAHDLTAEGIATARGGRAWYPSTIRQALLTANRGDRTSELVEGSASETRARTQTEKH